MFPIYFVVGLLNIFSQHHNYGIQIKDPDFDIRVRRDIGEDAKQQVLNLHNNEDTNLNREKRSAYYEKIRVTSNDIQQYSNGNNNNGSQSARKNGNRYDIFNPNWNFLFNTTRKTRNGNNSRVNNNRPIINSYPYGYPSGYGPKKNSATGYDRITTTIGYRNQDSNTPYFYNYQNPDGRNFAGYVGYASNVSEQESTPGPRYSPRPNNNNKNAWNNVLAPYPPTNTQRPLTYTSTNNLPASYSTTNNTGVHNLPYTTNPVNGNYNNNFINVPKPYVKDNLSHYAPSYNNGTSNIANGSAVFNDGLGNWNNGTTNFSNGSTDISNGSVDFNNGTDNFDNGSPSFNGSYAPVNNTDTTVTTTEKIVSGCVICNIPCPQFMRRFGRFCMPEDVDSDY